MNQPPENIRAATSAQQQPFDRDFTARRSDWLTQPLQGIFDESAQRRVLNAVSLIAAALLSLEFVYIFATGQTVAPAMQFAFWIGLVGFLSVPFIIRATQSTAPGALIVLVAVASLIIVPAYYQGGTSALFTVWFLLVPLLAGIFLGHRIAIVMGVAGIAVMTGLFALESLGHLPEPAAPIDTLPAWLNLVAVIGFSAVIGAVAAKSFVSSSNRLHAARAADAAKARALEEAIEGIARIDGDGRLLTVNSAFAAMHAADTATLVGAQANDWILKQDRDELQRAVASLATQARQEVTVRGLREDGSSFYANIFLIAIPDGEPGSHYRFARDVTRQRELTEQLSQSEKMDAIGRLAGGIAHDFNNLLQTILGASDRLRREIESLPEPNPGPEFLSWIDTAAQRGASLTRQLLDFSHVQGSESGPIDVHQSLRRLIDMLDSVLGSSIRVESDLCATAPATIGDLARFESGLMNLAVNARDAMPHGGTLRFRTTEHNIDPSTPRFASFHLETDRFVCIEVTDTGEGIDASILDDIFDPFFTTKPVGKGTGLGLSLFYSYAREVGGALEVKSRPEEGTTVSIYLPLTDVSPAPAARPDRGHTTGNETILLAEDEPLVAQLIAAQLREAGFHVIVCGDGQEAIDFYRKHSDSIDLALLDYRMPRRDGVEVFDSIQKMSPDLPAILMSGNLAGAEIRNLERRGLRSVLRKPCSRDEVLRTVRAALDTEA